MQFTLVSTIFNEAKRLPQTISDLESQTHQPDEIIITDAGSNDGTWEMLKEWQQRSTIPIVLLQEERCNVAHGRNLAIAAAQHEVIVSTDFGCRFHPQWLESITGPFQREDGIEVVGGAFSVVEEEIQTLSAKGNYLLTNGYKLELNEAFIPSSRSIAYQKDVWRKIGGYCEWLTLAADDLVFGMQIKSMGYKIHLVNAPFVYWGRHTKHQQYTKEAYRYGLGDGEAKVNFRNFVSLLIETSLRYLFFAGIITTLTLFVWLGLSMLTSLSLFLCLASAIGLRSYVRTVRNWKQLRSAKYHLGVLLYSLWMLEKQRMAYAKGYLKGYFFDNPAQKRGAAQLHQMLNQQL
jgi:glycosyltransferase involved in cell wall biosynthesis